MLPHQLPRIPAHPDSGHPHWTHSQNMPHYFILMDRNLDEYGKQFMCVDYAQNLCHWILENYHVVYKISGEPQYIMLRKNK